ncbi:MAG: alpha/beta hydrolase fold domain-containing protein [Gammaproteobacteria bacterium]
MTEWMVGLALFNVFSVLALFVPRASRRRRVPWLLFGVSLLASELAWIWLPLQALLALVFSLGGALDATLGRLALYSLLLSWPVLGWCLHVALRAGAPVETALQSGLGEGHRDEVPEPLRRSWRGPARFEDWRKPFRAPPPGVECLRNIPYGPHGVRQMLDIYRPRVIPPGGCPVLLQIHGGAWMIGDKAHQALPLMHLLASKGWICVAANYRLSPSIGFPVHLEDCKRALCWIRTEGAAYGMDPRFVAVTGGSAGGHLAALMGLTANRPELQQDFPGVDTSVQACVSFYGVYDFLGRYQQHPNAELVVQFLTHRVVHETPEQNPALWDLASPVMQIHPDAPPFMLVHGTLDSLAAISDGQLFAQRLRRESKSPVVFLELPGTEHGFDGLHSPRTEAVIDGVERFLDWTRSRA